MGDGAAPPGACDDAPGPDEAAGVRSATVRPLVACGGVDAYREVSRAADGGGLPLPFFGQRGPPGRGLERLTTMESYDDWTAARTRGGTTADPAARPADAGRRRCLTLDEPHCVAVASMLRRAAGKAPVVVSPSDDWTEVVRRAFSRPFASLTVVLPGWREGVSGPPMQARVSELLRVLRTGSVRAGGRPWGLLTGSDPRALSLNAVKAVVGRELCRDGAGRPSAVVSSRLGGRPSPALPRWSPGRGGAPLCWMDGTSLSSGGRRALLGRRWDVLVFQGHGRSYCACEGFLCGARRPDERAARDVERCVHGLDCASEAYPRLDPRRYDARTLVLDTCGAGNLAARGWEDGLASLAFLAADGPAAAVIAGDTVTEGARDEFADVLYALATSPTAGEATAELCRLRSSANLPFPFYLLGDPDWPLPGRLLESWTTSGSVGPARRDPSGGVSWRVRFPAVDAPLLRIRLPDDGAAETSHHVSTPGERPRLDGCARVDGDDGVELWVGAGGTAPGPREVMVVRRRSPTLHPGLVADARRLLVSHLDWREELPESAEAVVEAARRVVRWGRTLEEGVDRAAVGRPGAAVEAMGTVLGEWEAVQQRCLRELIGRAEEGLWPHSLWQPSFGEARLRSDPCPRCASTPTVARPYTLSSGVERLWWECFRCDLISDVPILDGAPGVSLDGPDVLTPGGSARAAVTLEPGSGGTPRHGAAAVAVDRSGHGVSARPGIATFEAPAGETQRAEFTLDAPADGPAAAHTYRLRGLVLANGWWFWASRPLVVAGGEGGTAPAGKRP